MPQSSTISRTRVRLKGERDRRVREKLFAGLILLVLGVALFALRTFSDEKWNVGLLMEQLPNRCISLFFGTDFVHISFLVQNDRVLSR